jgi:hypothetical protein
VEWAASCFAASARSPIRGWRASACSSSTSVMVAEAAVIAASISPMLA